MKFEIRQRFILNCARFLPNLPASHPCRQIHGHLFQVTLILQGPLTPEGWVKDFGDIQKVFQEHIGQKWDHRLLNEIPGLENPTSEIMALRIYEILKPFIPELHQVVIQESRDSWACYPVR